MEVNNRINCLHERTLRIIYDDSTSYFVFLLERDNSVSVHDCNIQQLAIKMYIVAHGPTSKATSVLSLRNSNLHTRSQSEFLVPQINIVYFGQSSIRYFKTYNMELTSTNFEKCLFFF